MNLSDPPSAPAPPTMEENYAQVQHNTRRHDRQHVTMQEGYSQVSPTTEDYSKTQHSTRRPKTNRKHVSEQEGYSHVYFSSKIQHNTRHARTKLLLPLEGYGQVNTVNQVNPGPLPDHDQVRVYTLHTCLYYCIIMYIKAFPLYLTSNYSSLCILANYLAIAECNAIIIQHG